MRTWRLRVFALVVAVAILIGFGASESRADVPLVSLSPASTLAGSVEDLTFRVANDRSDAFVKAVEVVFPGRPTFSTAVASAPDGWSATIDRSSGTVTSALFDGGQIADGQSASFVLTATIPFDSATAKFLIIETFSDGQIVRWSEADAQHPAPVLNIVGAVTTAPPVVGGVTTTTSAAGVSDTTSHRRGLKAGDVFIALGVGLFIAVLHRRRRLQRQNKKDSVES